jgi:transposase-like protein
MKKSANKQHYLLSAKARSFSLLQIARLSDDEAFEMFKDARWPEGVKCPKCTAPDHYWLGTRKQWRCKCCKHTFSVTSGTIFNNRKLPLATYLAAIAIYTNAVKGISAMQLMRDLDVQYKTAFVLAHKLRESLMDDEIAQLDHEVEVDAAYVNGHVRPANNRHNRIDRRLKVNQDPEKRAVLVARERHEVDGEGGFKTVTAIAKSENEESIKAFVKKHVTQGTMVSADENRSYDALHAQYKMERVNHSKHYVGANGENTNQAESFFSRFRRMQLGQVHKFGNLYLNRYVNEAAFREDTRRKSNGEIFFNFMERCTDRCVSRHFAGYWQGNKKQVETLI